MQSNRKHLRSITPATRHKLLLSHNWFGSGDRGVPECSADKLTVELDECISPRAFAKSQQDAKELLLHASRPKTSMAYHMQQQPQVDQFKLPDLTPSTQLGLSVQDLFMLMSCICAMGLSMYILIKDIPHPALL
ncbi:hypothetical protein KR222_011265 [Zaprionus bogoriensis]|nr:hypothetical protein KR222_011265 [Zaprionus bogoriensis]